jgi:hypothetical protein
LRAIAVVESVPGVLSVEHDIAIRAIPVAVPAPETAPPAVANGEAEVEETP